MPLYPPPATGGGLDSVHFRLIGRPIVGTKYDGVWLAPLAGTIARVTLYRRTAGSGSSVIIDLNKNGTTVYTTQGNRPTITAASGNDQTSTTTPDVLSFAQGDRFEWDVDQIETGVPLDLTLILAVTYP